MRWRNFKSLGEVGVPPGGRVGKYDFTSDRYDISDCQVVSDIYGHVYRVISAFVGADPERFLVG
jgi:hypothetical protein